MVREYMYSENKSFANNYNKQWFTALHGKSNTKCPSITLWLPVNIKLSVCFNFVCAWAFIYLFLCACAFIYDCEIMCVHIFLWVRMRSYTYVSACAFIYDCECMCVHERIHIRLYVCALIYVYDCEYTCVYVTYACAFIYLRDCMCVHISCCVYVRSYNPRSCTV